jgi:two-component system nitrogen regulation sensor histidine kinase NtrY
MRSLRSRLILGSALVAVVPLALAVIFFTRELESMVRVQAEARLGDALGGLRTDFRRERETLSAQLAALGRDPTLRGHYVLRVAGERDLLAYLVERRSLLGLDRLRVLDLSGRVTADGSTTLATGEALILSATEPILQRGRSIGSVEGGRILDAAMLERMKRAAGMDLVLRDGSGRIRASTLPDGTAPYVAPAVGATRLSTERGSFLARSLALDLGGDPGAIPTITGLVPTDASDRTIRSLRGTVSVLGGIALVLAVLLGTLWSLQVSRPVERLAAFSREVALGRWDRPLEVKSVRELETLVEALERMRLDLQEYRERLVISERQAAWSQMARRVAHEIKNPLTPIAISIEDLRRSYEQHREDFPSILEQAVRTIAEEIATMKRLLHEFTEFERFPAPRLEAVRASALLADIGARYGREIAAGHLRVAGRAGPGPSGSLAGESHDAFLADRDQVREALVNLVKNALEAIEPGGVVTVTAAVSPDAVEFVVEDDGPGLGEEARAQLFVPGFTTKPDGSGLGLSIAERIVSEHGGTLRAESREPRGTRFHARFPRERRS